MNAIVPVHAKDIIEARALVRIVIVGHVDHGKSTLIGRLLHDTGNLPEGKIEQLKSVSARRGMPFEWSFVLDALQAERDQNITIDTSQIRFRTRTRDFVLIDAPGHTEFLRNMITGASQADAAVLVIDAFEGVREQTRRHGYLLQLLGIRQIIVVINKMDRVAYDAERFRVIETEITDYLGGFGIAPAAVIPVSARDGVGIVEHTNTSNWSRPTLVDALDGTVARQAASDNALRFPVQAVYKFDDRRILAGRVESGRINVGDDVVIQPGGARTRVRSIESWRGGPAQDDPRTAAAGESIGITLEAPLFVERGHVVSRADAAATASRQIRARVFWLHHQPLEVGMRLKVRIATAEVAAVVSAIDAVVDPGELTQADRKALRQNEVGEIGLAFDRPIACDCHDGNTATGRVVLDHDGRIAGGGLVLELDPVAQARVNESNHGPHWHAARVIEFSNELAPLSPKQRLGRLRAELTGKITFTTSFGLEDQAILHWIAELDLDIDIVTLDTGRLFPETYDVWENSERRYRRRIRAVYPNHTELEALVAQQGINGFFDTVDARRACCHVRKFEPLGRALTGAEAWITGLRGNQSDQRKTTSVLERDAERQLLKLNPLFDWTRAQVLAFAAEHAVPMNALHAKGYASIGCAPCTRSITAGEDERAGRWWWEQNEKKECGLHIPLLPPGGHAGPPHSEAASFDLTTENRSSEAQ